ncbi:MAG: phenylacetate--CoA ligase family protein [Marinobacter sp.]
MVSTVERLYLASPVWLQNILVSAYGYHLYRKRYLGSFPEILDLARKSRQWSDVEVEAYQSEQLFDMVRYCRRQVPYYQRAFAESGLHERDISSTKDVGRLPVLTKQELRANIADFKGPDVPAYMTQHTSGSTGTPLALQVDEYTYKLAMALLVEHEEYHGVPFGAKRATFAGRMVQPSNKMSPPFARINRAENQKLFSSYHLNERTFPWYRKELDRFQPKELIGYASALSDLAAQYQRVKVVPAFRPKAIVTNSESLLSWQRERIERVFGAPVFDYYGTAEYVVFAGQDERGLYRPNPIIGITETDKHSAHESEGRILATTLTNKAMPLLRYDIGDTATMGPLDQRGLITFTSINGRRDDYLETRDGRQIGRIDHIFKGVTGVREGQVIQSNPGAAALKIVLAENEPFNRNQLIENARSRLGQDFKIEIDLVEAIPRGPNGKFKSVVRRPS